MRIRDLLRRVESYVVARLGHHLRRLQRDETDRRNLRLLARARSCGNGIHILGPMTLTGVENLTLGDNVHIGSDAFIRAEGGLDIGSHTHISRNVVIYTMNHRTDGARIPYDDTFEYRPVRIGKCVWIGMNVTIAPGTTIGDGAIIGLGTSVGGDVPAMAIVVSSKPRIVGWRDRDHYERCERENAFGGRKGMPIVAEGGTSAPRG